jgi:hypothetical protein
MRGSCNAPKVSFVFFSNADLENLIVSLWRKLEERNIGSPTTIRLGSRPPQVELGFDRASDALAVSKAFANRLAPAAGRWTIAPARFRRSCRSLPDGVAAAPAARAKIG